MRFVAKCEECGEQKILDEWGKCKRCFNIWFKKSMLTDKDSWYIITDNLHGPQPDPVKVDAAVKRMEKALELNVPEPGPTDPEPGDIFQNPKIKEKLRKIFRKGIETRDLRYIGSKCDEKI